MTTARVGTRTPRGWETWRGSNVEVGERGVTLATGPRPKGRPIATGVAAVDIAVGVCGRLYVLDENWTVWRYRVDTPGTADRRIDLADSDGTWFGDGDERGSGDDDERGGGDDDREAVDDENADGDEAGAENTDENEAGAENTDEDEAGAENTDGDEAEAEDDGKSGLSALCATADTLYVAREATEDDDARLYGFSLNDGTLRWAVDAPAGRPVALTRTDHGVYLLDAGTAHGEGVVTRVAPDGSQVTVTRGLTAPIDLAEDARGTLFVLDTERPTGEPDDPDDTAHPPVVWELPADVVTGEETGTGEQDGDGDDRSVTDLASSKRLFPLGAVCLAGGHGTGLATRRERTLVAGVVPDDPDGETLARYRFEPDAFEEGQFVAVGGFSRSCTALRRGPPTGDDGGVLYAIDSEANQVYAIDERGQYGAWPGTNRHEGLLVARFDSGVDGTTWHRVRVDIERTTRAGNDASASTQVLVRYGVTDRDDDVEDLGRIEGIGDAYAQRLRASGVTTISALARHAVDDGAASGTEGRAQRLATLATPLNPSDQQLGNAARYAETWLSDAVARTNERYSALARPDPRDALLPDATGRYLWVVLELTGADSASPLVSSFTASFPRESYLRYLPEVYQTDASSAAFLERFLSMFESVFADVEADLADFTRYLDPDGTDAEYLSWLERWLAVKTDEEWPDGLRRTLLARAPSLYLSRGTPAGLHEVLSLYLSHTAPTGADENDGGDDGGNEDDSHDDDEGRHPTQNARNRARTAVTERGWSGDSVGNRDDDPDVFDSPTFLYLWENADLDVSERNAARAEYERLLNCPHCFVVLVGTPVEHGQRRVLDWLIGRETPAHTTGRAVRVRPWFQLGAHTYLGANSRLASREFVVGTATLAEDTVLTGSTPRDDDRNVLPRGRTDAGTDEIP